MKFLNPITIAVPLALVAVGFPLWLVSHTPATTPPPAKPVVSIPTAAPVVAPVEEQSPPEDEGLFAHPIPLNQAQESPHATQAELVPRPASHRVSSYRRRDGTLVPSYVAESGAPSTSWQAPTVRSSDSGGFVGNRGGATCNDGTHSDATGKGACARHGGVAHWD